MSDGDDQKSSRNEVLALAVNVVSAYVGRNPIPTSQITEVIQSVYGALSALGGSLPAAPAEALRPAVPIKKSVTPEYVVCLEDGKKLKMLKRHLRTTYGLSPEEYRAKWGLPHDYPMVAPKYAEQRSAFAKKIGLGRKPGEKRGRKGRK